MTPGTSEDHHGPFDWHIESHGSKVSSIALEMGRTILLSAVPQGGAVWKIALPTDHRKPKPDRLPMKVVPKIVEAMSVHAHGSSSFSIEEKTSFSVSAFTIKGLFWRVAETPLLIPIPSSPDLLITITPRTCNLPCAPPVLYNTSPRPARACLNPVHLVC